MTTVEHRQTNSPRSSRVPGLLPSLAAGLALSLLASTQLSAQQQVVDEGTFRIFRDGAEVGSESFTIRRDQAGPDWYASGEISMRGEDGPVDMVARMSSRSGVLSYQNRISGGPISVVAIEVAGRNLVAQILSEEGERQREIPADAGSILLEEDVAHHFYFLGPRTEQVGNRIPAVIPMTGRRIDLTVARIDQVELPMGSDSVPARLVHLEGAGGERLEVWFDRGGRVLQVEIAARRYRAVRNPS